MDDAPTTKAAIIERNRRAAARIEAALARLSDEQFLAPPREGSEWTLKDTLAHLAEPWFAAQMEAHLDGREPTALECYGHEEPPGPKDDLTSNDGRNAWNHRYHRDLPLAEVRRRYADTFARLDRVIERLPEPAFAAPYSIAPLGYAGLVRPAEAGEQGFPLWRWIQGAYWHHLEDHARDFEAAARASSQPAL